MLERYLIPLAPYALTAAGCILGLFFLLSFEKEMHRFKSQAGRRKTGDQAAARDLNAQLQQLNQRLQDAEERAGILVAQPSPKTSLNLNRRTQILRMSRRGERIENIAASLSVPRREVELLLKIHGMMLKGPGEKA
jgi:hypothetical protein